MAELIRLIAAIILNKFVFMLISLIFLLSKYIISIQNHNSRVSKIMYSTQQNNEAFRDLNGSFIQISRCFKNHHFLELSLVSEIME